MEQSRWQIYRRADTDLLAHLCRIRGLDRKMLVPNFKQQLHDPNLLPGMKMARQLIRRAKKENWQVTIFGDYDADGTPAAALLSMTLDRLGITNKVILPTRATGYGLRESDVEDIAKESGLLVTVDTGVSSVEEIARAKELGLAVIVLDHHLPKAELPPADALVDPFVPGSKYPFPHLCGCALAYKLTVALSEDFPDELSEAYCKWLLELVAISTVADMMPLIGENRVLVHYGLQVLSKTKRPGLSALLDQAGLSKDQLTSRSLGYVIGPRLNASGRLFDNRPAYELIKTTDPAMALQLALQIEQANSERQELVAQTLLEADKLLWQQNAQSDRILIVYGQNWPAGVLGLVAGKIVGQTNRPVIVLSNGPRGLTGSGRSIERYPLIDGLEASKKYLDRFGGHRLAAGLGLIEPNLQGFVDSIKQHATDQLSKEDLRPTITIDALLADTELTSPTAELVETMAPFGQGNQVPLMLVPSVVLSKERLIGSKGDHFKAVIVNYPQPIDVVGFGLAERYMALGSKELDLVGELEHNLWNGRKTLQLKVKDFRLSGSGADDEIALPD